VLKKVCRQLGVFKWPYKETKLIARRQGRVIAASAPIPHDLRNINAAVASASTTSLSTTFLDSSSTSSSSSSSSGKRKSRSTSETVSGGSLNGSTVRGAAAGAKRQRVAPAVASTIVARDTARDTKSPRSACSSRSRSSSSRSYQHVAPTQIKGPEREQQPRIQDEGELAQPGAWNPDDDEDQDEKAHADSCERSTRDHRIGPNDPNLHHIEEQEIDEDEGKEEEMDEDEGEGEGNFEDDGGIAGIWQYTVKERPTESDGRRLMRPDTPPGLREATGSDNGYDQEYGHFEPEHSTMGRDQQPVHGNLSEMYGCDTRYSGTYGRLVADSFTRPHVCDMPSSAAMARASVRQVSSFPVDCSQGCRTQCFQLLSARLVTSSRMFLFCSTTRLQVGANLSC
jgi:hypothetical protein